MSGTSRPSPGWIPGLEAVTAVAAIAGGLLLIAAPDGHLLQAKMSALTGSPFDDWRLPGILLLGLIGGGFAVTSLAELGRWRHARALTALASIGLIAFEAAEASWLGFQPLEAVFSLVGVLLLIPSLHRARRPCPASPAARNRSPIGPTR